MPIRLFCIPLVVLMLVAPRWAKARDAERTRLLELQPQVGYSLVNLTGFSQSRFYATLPTTAEEAATARIDTNAARVPVRGDGLSAGLGLQLKLWIFTLAGRYNYTHASEFGVQTMGGDLGMRLGTLVGLYGRLGGGYATISGLPSDLRTDGFYASLAMGLDIRVARPISVGFGVDGDVLLLSQTSQLGSAANLVQNRGSQDDVEAIDGSAAGFQLRPQVHLTWHI